MPRRAAVEYEGDRALGVLGLGCVSDVEDLRFGRPLRALEREGAGLGAVAHLFAGKGRRVEGDRLGRQLGARGLLGDMVGGLLGLGSLGVLGDRGGGRADEEGAQANGAQGRSKSFFHGLLRSVLEGRA